mmetsp:Transcript_21222/g.26777  ORF Transcript_21222/g.26777 Transcript_21222/m.26777 type:complete len:208 (-) Transcript_21222:2-625(-)
MSGILILLRRILLLVETQTMLVGILHLIKIGTDHDLRIHAQRSRMTSSGLLVFVDRECRGEILPVIFCREAFQDQDLPTQGRVEVSWDRIILIFKATLMGMVTMIIRIVVDRIIFQAWAASECNRGLIRIIHLESILEEEDVGAVVSVVVVEAVVEVGETEISVATLIQTMKDHQTHLATTCSCNLCIISNSKNVISTYCRKKDLIL